MSNERTRGSGVTAKSFSFKLSRYPLHVQRSGIKLDEKKVSSMISDDWSPGTAVQGAVL